MQSQFQIEHCLGCTNIFCTSALNTWGSCQWGFNIAYDITLV